MVPRKLALVHLAHGVRGRGPLAGAGEGHARRPQITNTMPTNKIIAPKACPMPSKMASAIGGPFLADLEALDRGEAAFTL